MDLKVTNIEDLKKVAQGEVIQYHNLGKGYLLMLELKEYLF
nr:hypothetical protein [Clostridium botulinum]